MERVESQLALGVERMLESIIDWTRTLLARVRVVDIFACTLACVSSLLLSLYKHFVLTVNVQDQQKTDFRPEENSGADIVGTTKVSQRDCSCSFAYACHRHAKIPCHSLKGASS